MKITLKLTILFTIITAGILFLFAFIIFQYAKNDRENEFYDRIKIKSYVKGELFFDAKASPSTLQDIHMNNLKVMNEAEIAIYDADFNLLFHDNKAADRIKETPEMLQNILKNGELKSYIGDWQMVGEVYHFGEKKYIITAIAYDHYGYNKIDDMYTHMVYAYILSIVVICLSGLFFSKKAFEPVKDMTRKVNKITASKFNVRLDVKNSKDELSALAITFNEMLDRLENSFETQKSFVSNISHELRTPLSAIIAELELSLSKNHKEEEYRQAIENTMLDAQRLVRLSSSLLDLAKASYDPSEISFKEIRIDEILLDARQMEQRLNSENKIDIHFDVDFENDQEMLISGNEYLLKVAFANIFNNGCKYSFDKRCSVAVSFENNKIILLFSNKGIGINPEELDSIFKPFFRGENKQIAHGNGIGLSLTQKIIALHKGTISVTSEINKETSFKVILPLAAF
ncbi:HAMP domain-containing sensor histidine kinase [Flavobacterium reichenbachii]|uniref:histidine kinase n=1 Tax=Flavobacterium reichenbachii TaxID=362418 RepID=A0A085ZI53_9FLAO|nr:HAMP domain-containing sensor histidine kinase [Flavobacterium reichenbachii]KFF04117.1 histidine kinase [Flavobacterium reichenbachii]OXB15840.1 two-component sensor histidine kinase [Flavobacterium reichenbachii]